MDRFCDRPVMQALSWSRYVLSRMFHVDRFMVDPLNSSDQTSRHAEPPPELEPEPFGGEDFRDVVGGGALGRVVVVGSPGGRAVTGVPGGVRDARLGA